MKNFIVLLAFSILFLLLILIEPNRAIGLYGILLLIYLLSKMVLSFLYKPVTEKLKKDYKVACVIPMYNEEPQALINTLESILDQEYTLESIYIVDDGSPDMSGYFALQHYILENQEKCKKVILHRLDKNAGKRHAQYWAFKQSDAEIFFTVDSDTSVAPNALEELLRPFNDETVFAVTGHINARNRDENLLTQLIDIRYDNAFRVERAAQSVTGNILACSGPLTVYRREVIIPNLEKYINQTFLGVKVNIGDDRCLTNYANKLGKTKYQSTARCVTDVPNNLPQFLKQQLRWNKSFFRESMNAIKMFFIRPAVSLWSTLEISLFFLLTYSMFNLIFNFANSKQGLMSVGFLILGVIISALARNVHYILKHPLLFLMSPLYAVIHLLFLQPLRLYALLTIRDAKWGTREKKEEEIKEVNNHFE